MISIIVAYDKNGCIGKDGNMPWHISADLKWFKQCTLNHKVVMGRKTYQAIGSLLKNRTNIIVSAKDIDNKDCLVIHDFKKFLIDNQYTDEEIFVIGGASIYKQAIPYTTRFYITFVDTEVINGDVFFPKLNLEEAKIKYHKKDYDKYNLDFYVIDKSKCNLDFDIIDNYKNIKEI